MGRELNTEDVCDEMELNIYEAEILIAGVLSGLICSLILAVTWGRLN